jgi:hypothetical protein
MSNEISIFESGNLQVPAHLQDAFGENNLEKRSSVDSLTYEGKVWSVRIDGEKRSLTRVNEDGDDEPLSTMRVVILDAAKTRGRTYYEGAYDPGKIAAPKCWSDNGQQPHASVAEPQCGSCKACPMSAKGSKITEQGKAIAACSQHRMLAVVPAGKLDSVPLRLKIAITSDWDADGVKGEEGKKGWLAFSNYRDHLAANGLSHSALVVTKIKFDNSVAYPKLLFSPDRWLNADEVAVIKPAVGSEEVKALLGGEYTPNGVDGVRTEATTPAPAPTVKAAPKPAPAPDPAPAPAPAAGQAVEVPDDIDALLDEWSDE